MSFQRHLAFVSGWVLILSVLTAQRLFAAPANESVARIHWLGLKQLSADTNAARLMTIWNLPESRRLEQQTLAKFSQAPWRWLRRNVDTNAAALLRPLLDDVVSNESCLFIRQGPGQPAQLAFAIRLDDRRAAFWRLNLAQVLKSLTGITPEPAPSGRYGWSLKKHHAPNVIELSRAGGWTVVGMAEDDNGLLQELLAGIQRGRPPMIARDAAAWLEADFDPVRLAEFFSLSACATGGESRGELVSNGGFLPNHVFLTLTGDGKNVLTRGTADFSRPLALHLEPWNIPTNLIAEPLTGLALARGFKPWLESSEIWTNLSVGPAPDQLCCWAAQGFPMLSYFAGALPDASNEVSRLTDYVLQQQKIGFAAGSQARFEKSQIFNGLSWKGVPFMMPFLRSITVGNRDFICGGGLQNVQTYPAGYLVPPDIMDRTNLVYYDSEATGPRIDQWIDLSQFARYVLGKAQLPPDSAGLLWLKAIAPRLGTSLTDVTQTGPDQLSFRRRSDTGFTALELNLLADWLESPQFPRSLHSLTAPPPAR